MRFFVGDSVRFDFVRRGFSVLPRALRWGTFACANKDKGRRLVMGQGVGLISKHAAHFLAVRLGRCGAFDCDLFGCVVIRACAYQGVSFLWALRVISVWDQTFALISALILSRIVSISFAV